MQHPQGLAYTISSIICIVCLFVILSEPLTIIIYQSFQWTSYLWNVEFWILNDKLITTLHSIKTTSKCQTERLPISFSLFLLSQSGLQNYIFFSLSANIFSTIPKKKFSLQPLTLQPSFNISALCYCPALKTGGQRY